ncbi:MAG TPA: DUF4230 domain-containing protein [Cyclobacteriaceae bacterium]|nr:DUF4230 domain-containing protein [Cyclobacteriaceae bacterium]
MISRNLKLLIALVIVGTIAAYVVLVTIPTQLAERSYEAAKTLGEDFRKTFQFTPEVIVNNTIVLNQQAPILELAVLSQSFEHRYTWANTWIGSTKQVFITGNFVAKTGFDLNEKFSIRLANDTAYVLLTEPVILSVESQGDIVYRDEHGIWNWVSPDDRTKATNAFITDARKYAEQATFVQDAKSKTENQLKTLLQPYAKGVVIQYTLHEKISPQ